MDSVINVQIYKIDNEKLKYQYFPPSWEIWVFPTFFANPDLIIGVLMPLYIHLYKFMADSFIVAIFSADDWLRNHYCDFIGWKHKLYEKNRFNNIGIICLNVYVKDSLLTSDSRYVTFNE
jgi:hypothetical protein